MSPWFTFCGIALSRLRRVRLLRFTHDGNGEPTIEPVDVVGDDDVLANVCQASVYAFARQRTRHGPRAAERMRG